MGRRQSYNFREPGDPTSLWFDVSSFIHEGPVALRPAIGRNLAFKPRDEPIEISSGMMEHPLVGLGVQSPRPHHPEGKACPPNMAFISLIAAIFTRTEILDENGDLPCPMRLELAGSVSLVADVSSAWNWRPRDAKPFLLKLSDCGLLGDELTAALVNKLGRVKERRFVTGTTRAAILAKTGGHCVYCGVRLTSQHGKPNSYNADHLLPASRGASDDPALLVPACASCNGKKGNKTLIEFIVLLKSEITS